jgi:hypothetical protein
LHLPCTYGAGSQDQQGNDCPGAPEREILRNPPAPWAGSSRSSERKKTFYSQTGRGKRQRIGDADVITLPRAEYRARDEGRAGATIVRDLNNLRSVFRRAIDANYLRDNPLKGWEKPEVEDAGLTRCLTGAEEARLRPVLRQRDGKARRERVRANKWRAARGYEPLPEVAKAQFSDHLTPMVLVSISTGLRYAYLEPKQKAEAVARLAA